METEVFNLVTGESQIYPLPPEQAVVAAHDKELGDKPREHWTNKPYITKCGRSVYCGDWTAPMPVHYAVLKSDRQAICGIPLLGEWDALLRVGRSATYSEVTCPECIAKMKECYLI